MFRKSVALVAALSLGLFLSACDDDKAKGSVMLNFSHTMAPNSLSDLAANQFKKIIEEKSGGTIKVNIVTNCGLSGGDLTKAIEMVGTGDIDMHASAPTNAATFDPRFYIFWMPFLFPTTESLANVTQSPDIHTMVDGWFKPLNIKLLGIHNAGARQISNSAREISTPADLKSMNVRVPGAQLFIDCFRDSFEANPTAMDFSEVYTALQQKTIDGQENPISVFDSSKFSEVQPYLTLWDYVRDSTGWYMSQKTFDKLTEEQRQLVLSSAKEAIAWADDYITKSEEEILKKLAGQGVKITALSLEQKQSFAELCKPLYTKYNDIIGKDVIEQFQKTANQ